MATKKAASTKKSSARTPSATKTSVRTVSASAKRPTASVSAVTTGTASAKRKWYRVPSNTLSVVLAELFGTFILTLVFLTTASDTSALYVGLAYAVLILAIGAVSGAHLNPAVTFGLWSVRRVKSIMLPFYWVSQFLGVILALVISHWIASSDIKLDFSHFWTMDWKIFGLELVGTAVFLFGYTALVGRTDLSKYAKAIGLGTTLLVGLVVAGTIYSGIRTAAISSYQQHQSGSQSQPAISHDLYVKGAVLNPAIALATPDYTQSELLNSGSDNNANADSRLTIELVLGTLVGAVVGANLYTLIIDRKKN